MSTCDSWFKQKIYHTNQTLQIFQKKSHHSMFIKITTHLSNCMKTKFHSSITSGLPVLTRHADFSEQPWRAKCISVQGPHGPVSPIIQKFSLSPYGKIFSAGILQKIKDTKINQLHIWETMSCNYYNMEFFIFFLYFTKIFALQCMSISNVYGSSGNKRKTNSASHANQ